MRNLTGVDVSGLQLPLNRDIWQADIVHFHDFSVAYGALIAYLISLRKPTVFRLPDFSGVTGGCLYPNGCRRFQTGCGDCPQLGTWPLMLPIDLTEQHFRLHQRIADTTATVGVTPSQYMAGFAREGAWSNARVEVIPNAVDTTVFHPGRRERGRERLGLTQYEKCMLFVAVNVLDERKGFDDFARAFRPILREQQDMRLAVVGDMPHLPGRYHDLTDRLILTGPIADDARLADVYAAADLYVVPSHHDTFNITILEAMSSGTPVVAFPTGGMTEVFEHGKGGWFTQEATHDSLRETLFSVLTKTHSKSVRAAAREWVLENFTVEQLRDRHLQLYRMLHERGQR